jgi:V/A-type H+/Na+-transporting ATPase subunit E
MVETIETFINKLQEDGVQAGQQAAQEIIEKAQQQARQRLAEAEEQAEQIIQQAHQEGERNRVRVETELKLAARDIVFRVQETLNRVLQTVLAEAVDGKLNDAEFLGGLIRDVVMRYVEADVSGGDGVDVHVSEEMQQRLLSGAVTAFRPDQAEQARIKLIGQLKKAGFEYKVADGMVEVTEDSVVQVLSGFLSAELRRRVEEERARRDAEA